MSSKGSAVTQENTGTLGVGHVGLVHQGAEGLHGGLHEGGVEGAGHGEALGADLALGQGGLGLVEGCGGARQHQLVGRVVVGHRQPGGLGHLVDRSAVAPGADGDHPAVTGLLRGLLHQAPAGGDQAQAVCGRERLGCHEGAYLAK